MGPHDRPPDAHPAPSPADPATPATPTRGVDRLAGRAAEENRELIARAREARRAGMIWPGRDAPGA